MVKENTWNVKIANACVDAHNITTPKPDLLELRGVIFWTVLSMVSGVLGCGGWASEMWRPAFAEERIPPLERFILLPATWFMWILQGFVPGVAFIIGPQLCRRTIVRNVKFMVYFLSACAAVVTRCILPHNMDVLMAVTCLTLYLHALCQVLRFTSDISAMDVLLGAIMQVAIYTTPQGHIRASMAVLGACGSVIVYKYICYSGSSLDVAEDKETLPK